MSLDQLNTQLRYYAPAVDYVSVTGSTIIVYTGERNHHPAGTFYLRTNLDPHFAEGLAIDYAARLGVPLHKGVN